MNSWEFWNDILGMQESADVCVSYNPNPLPDLRFLCGLTALHYVQGFSMAKFARANIFNKIAKNLTTFAKYFRTSARLISVSCNFSPTERDAEDRFNVFEK